MKKKLIIWTVVVALVTGLGYAGWRYQKAHAAPEIAWKTSPIEKRKISAKVAASGTLQATVTVQIGAQVSGRIQKLNADFNTTVKKGQLLAKLDPQLFQAAVEQANANYLSAKASVAKAEAQQKDAELVLARTKTLSDQALASAADLQTAETNVAVAKAATDVAKASLAQSSASLHQAQVNLSYTEIYSPIDGTVISRAVDVGQTVAASLQAPVLFTIAEDLPQDAGPHQRRRGRRRSPPAGHGRDLHRRRVPGPDLQGQGRPDPQRAADASRTSSPTTR